MAAKKAKGKLAPGDRAPAFSLKDENGAVFKSASAKGHKLMVFFYPKADTPGCTQQVCAMRDIAGEVGDTVIVGISPDTVEKQKKFAAKHSPGYRLLSDADHAIAEAFGVWGEKKLYGRSYMGIVRSAFLIDESGKIEHAWYAVSPKDTPKNLLVALG